MKKISTIVFSVLFILTNLTLQAEWKSPQIVTDAEVKFSNTLNASDGNLHTKSTDTSLRTDYGAFIEFNYSSAVLSNALRIKTDFETNIADKVDIDLWIEGANDYTDFYEGVLNAGILNKLDFNPVSISKVRVRFFYLQAASSLSIYELALFETKAILEAPAINVADVSSIDTNSAVLHSTLTNDGGSLNQVRFEYGLDTNYGSQSSWQTEVGSGDKLSQMVDGLTEGMTYHFRAITQQGTNGQLSYE